MNRFATPVPMTRVPRVSVVVPCYNYGRYLPQLLGELLDQPGVDVDVLIVDDASPDGSAEIAAGLVGDRVALLRHPENKGHIQTYNDGLAAVTGDYVVLLSADDMLPRGALTRAVALMEANPSVGFVYGFARSFSGEPPAVRSEVRNWSLWKGSEWIRLSAVRGRCFIASPEVVMRRAALEEVGLYDPRLPHSGDFDMWLRTALRWDVGRINGPVQALYRVHDSNMHLTTFAGYARDLKERRRTFDILFDEHAPHRVDLAPLRPAAYRALAREALRRAWLAHRDGQQQAVVDEYTDFARDVWPAIDRTLRGRAFRLLPGADRRLPALAPRQLLTRVRIHLRWRRERRYGT